MATWGTQDLAAALPVTDPAVAPATPVTEGPNPQEYGWAKAEGYDYSTYNKSNKELADAQALFSEQAANHQQAGLHSDDWAGNGAVYEWKDEYGDVGPRFEDLEKILFGGENRQTTGIKFDK
jgi:ATP-dependent RNA helicase DDX3X